MPTALVTGSLDHAGVTALTLKAGGFEVLLLANKARAVLVTDPTDGTPTFDMHLVRPLIEAIIADQGGHSVQVAVVNGLRSPEEIIAAARTQPRAWTAYPGIEPHLPFSDWRNEILCQSSLDSWT